ncbi:TIGR03808 family TAT-translocated repetitive protein [Phyllobacterium sp. SB3]|uniref:TIGR03808 family TAT-translocated repetitive protein n=1 Tax=Phyllobacterium sp. SB3 TaxID=3156073 RepID=UPI0032AF9B97
MINRRYVLGSLAGIAGAALLPHSSRAIAAAGAINAVDFGLKQASKEDQSAKFNELLKQAAVKGEQIFLPSGTYIVSDLQFPSYVNLFGVAGKTRLKFGGSKSLINGHEGHIQLTGLVLDGDKRPLSKQARGLIEISNVDHLVLDDCQIVNADKNALDLFKCGGRIENCRISGAADVAIFSADAIGMQITGNQIVSCGNGGIIVHRYEQSRDATLVTGNRVSKISANAGGTGQNGNGINVFRADNVIVANNIINGCAFSAIRANTAKSLQITGNNCTGSGETAIYAEFAFEGAVIANNLVDGGTNGISMVNFDSGGRIGTCSGNIVRNLSTKGPYVPGPGTPANFGIGISVEADVSIIGNLIENAPQYGIQLGWGPYMRNLVASGNIIRSSGEGIAVSVVKGVGSAIVTDNVIQGAKRGGIVGHSWLEITEKDLVASAAKHPNLTIDGNRIS